MACIDAWPAIDFTEPRSEPALAEPGRGAAEVVLYSPDHDASLASLGREHVRRVIDLWAERTETLLARPEIKYVLVFENRKRTIRLGGLLSSYVVVPEAA